MKACRRDEKRGEGGGGEGEEEEAVSVVGSSLGFCPRSGRGREEEELLDIVGKRVQMRERERESV
jgi:hypothetical protein